MAMLKTLNHSTWRIHFYFHINTGYLLIKKMKSMRPLSKSKLTRMYGMCQRVKSTKRHYNKSKIW